MAPTTRSARRSTLRSYTRWYSIDPSSRSASSSPIRKLAPKKDKSPVKEETPTYCPFLMNIRLPFEILEAIFLQLNRKTILVSAQRVCRYWSGIIKNSVPLQEMLLLRPATKPRIELWKNDKIFHRLFGCMLRSEWVPFSRYRKYKKQRDWLRPEASWRSMKYEPYIPAIWEYYEDLYRQKDQSLVQVSVHRRALRSGQLVTRFALLRIGRMNA